MMTKTRSLLLPAIAVVAGGLAAVLFVVRGSSGRDTQASAAAPAAETTRSQPTATAETDESSGDALSGTVLERIAVQRYTYLRIGDAGSEGTWVAVPSCEAKVGDRVSVRGAQRMTDFQSPTLKRTFPTIYFGQLEEAETGSGVHASAGEMDNPHAGLSDRTDVAADNEGSTLPAHHMTPQTLAEPVEVGQVAKATGPLGRTVAQVYAERAKLNGKQVRVRGVVVKSVANVLDRTFIHVRDGSGNAENNTNDLTITAAAAPKVGDKLLYEGTLAVDKDYGSGYRYQAVLENASVVAE